MSPLNRNRIPLDFNNYTDMNLNMNMMGPQQGSQMDTLDVTISIGFLRGIFMHENGKVQEWKHQNHAELDSVKIVIIAKNDANNQQADEFITSAPLEKPKPVGDWMNYTALFPLKGNNSVTKMTLPGLIQRDHTSGGYSIHGQYKRESVDLLITLIFGNEAITLGKARLVVTGEEVRTKQSDLPISISRDGILKAQKKSQFPMKRMTSLPRGKNDELAPVSFKYDRRRRKFQLETDAVLRVFFKVSPHDPYKNSMSSNMSLNNMNMNSSVSGQSFLSRRLFRGGGSVRSSSVPRMRSDVPSTVGGFSEPSSPRRSMMPSYPSQQSSFGRPPTAYSSPPTYIHGNDFGAQSVMSRSFHSAMNPGQSMQRPKVNRSPSMSGSPYGPVYGQMNNRGSMNGSFHGGVSPGRTGPPSGQINMNQRSQSAPKMRYSAGYGDHPSAYGGSSFGYGGGSGNMSRSSGSRRSHGNPNLPGGGQMQYGSSYNSYGGSSYGGPRKTSLDQNMGMGFNAQSYGGNRSRSQSPYISRI